MPSSGIAGSYGSSMRYHLMLGKMVIIKKPHVVLLVFFIVAILSCV